jgi:hypothetical protein
MVGGWDAAIVICSFSPYFMYLFFLKVMNAVFTVHDSTTIIKYNTVNFMVSVQVVCFKSSSCIHNIPVRLELDTASIGTVFPTFLVQVIAHILQGRKVKLKWQWFFGPLKVKLLRWFKMWRTKHLVQQRHVPRSWHLYLSHCVIETF